LCALCNGSCNVSRATADRYDPAELDEEPCPHCHGKGTTGLVGDICKVCSGATVVKRAVAQAYEKMNGR
jgi:DnaJ-class molecular chaperone